MSTPKPESKKAVPLSKKDVLASVAELPRGLRTIALNLLNRPIRPRLGSQAFARKNPARGVTPQEKEKLLKLQEAGLSYRELEVVGHFKAHNGNGAYRAVLDALDAKKEGKPARKVRAKKAEKVLA